MAYYQNLGGGTFAPRQVIDANLRTQDLRKEDVDGDGRLDLIYYYSNAYHVRLSLGNGTFLAPIRIGLGTTNDFAIADMNGDGLKDLVYLNSIVLYVAPATGPLQWDSGVLVSSGLSGNQSLEVGDFDRDGRMDILVVETGRTRCFYGVGFNQFEARAPGVNLSGAEYSLSGDFNRDGYLDVAILGHSSPNPGSGSVYLVRGDPFGGFSEAQLISDTVPRGYLFQTADLDSNGQLDLLVAKGYDIWPNTSPIYWLRNIANRAEAPSLSPETDSGSQNSDNLTNTASPDFTGRATPGKVITLISNVDGVLGSTVTGADGNWSITALKMSDGPHIVTIDDGSGVASRSLDVLIDTQSLPPTGLDLLAESDTGLSDTDDITGDSTPIIYGIGEAGSSITLISSLNGVIGSGIANTEFWIETSELSQGIHEITAVAIDTAGNTSAPSDPLVVTVDLNQPGMTTISPLTQSLDYQAQSYDIAVTSNEAWTASPNQSWVQLSRTSGNGHGTITVTVTENPSTTQGRSAIITVNDKTHDLTQAAAPVITTIDPVSRNVDATAQGYTIAVTSNGDWNASSDQAWATVSPPSGSGNGTVTVTVAEHLDTTGSRAAALTIGDQNHSLTQEAAPIITSLDPTSKSIDNTAQSYTIAVTSNGAWNASSDQAWATVSPSSGSGNDTVTVTVSAHLSTSAPRIANLTVGDQSHVLTQAEAPIEIGLSPPTQTIDYRAQSYSLVVTSNGAWNAESDQPWVTVSPASGTGNRTLTVEVEANPSSTASREATITVGDQEHALTQQEAPTPLRPSNVHQFESFDDGLPGPDEGWEFLVGNTGRIEAAEGAMRLDDSQADGFFTTNAAILHLDLEGLQDVHLAFRHRHSTGVGFPANGIYLSDDGILWRRIQGFPDWSSDWMTTSIDLGQAAASVGLPLTAGMQLKIQQYGERGWPTNGFEIDDVEVYAVPAPVSPGISPLLEDFAAGLPEGSTGWEFRSAPGARLDTTTGSLRMDASPASSSPVLNEAVWHLDLAGRSSATLSFRQRSGGGASQALPESFSDSANGDGIAVSFDRGQSWRTVSSIPAPGDEWTDHEIDLDALAALVGQPLPSSFQVKFQQFGQAPWGSDGTEFDDILLVTSASLVGSDPRVEKSANEPAEPLSSPLTNAIPWNESAAGRYLGLLRDPAAPQRILGMVESLTLSPLPSHLGPGATVSGVIRFQGGRLVARGTMAANGTIEIEISRGGADPVNVTLQLTRGTESPFGFLIEGTVGDSEETAAASLGAISTAAAPTSSPRDFYTFVLPSQPGWGERIPGGDGWGTAVVDSTGRVRLTGKLGDGSPFVLASFLSADGRFPIFRELYRPVPGLGRGYLAGEAEIRDQPDISDFDGALTWRKIPDSRERRYPAGFAVPVTLLGSRYRSPDPGERVLEELADQYHNSCLALIDPSLAPSGEILRVTSWDRANRIRHYGPEVLNAVAIRGNGLVRGGYFDRDTRIQIGFFGVALQKQGMVLGNFLLPERSGALRIYPDIDHPYPGSENPGPPSLLTTPDTDAAEPSSGGVIWTADAAGLYQGIVRAQVDDAISGGVESVRVARSGAVSGLLVIEGQRYRFRGRFDESGHASLTLPRRGLSPLQLEIDLEQEDGASDGYRLIGSVEIDGSPEFHFDSQQKPNFNRSDPAPQTGLYSVGMPAPFDVDSATEPGGDGSGSLRVAPTGFCRGLLVLGDGTRTSLSGHINRQGEWSLHRSLYRRNPSGFIAGRLVFRAGPGTPSTDLDGTCRWFKPAAIPRERLYPDGFDTQRQLIGESYTPPGRGETALGGLPEGHHNAWLQLSGPSPTSTAPPLASVDRAISWYANDRVAYYGPEQLVLRINRRNGMISGFYRDRDLGFRVPLSGVIFQAQGLATGHYLSGEASGRLVIEPRN